MQIYIQEAQHHFKTILHNRQSSLVPGSKDVHRPKLPLRIRFPWKRVCAINHTLRAGAAEQSHLSHSISELPVPLSLVIHEAFELLADVTVVGELAVRREDESAFGWLERF